MLYLPGPVSDMTLCIRPGIGTGAVSNLVSGAVGEVQLRLLHVERHARLLGHHLDVDRFSRLHAHHQLVPLTLAAENVAGHVSVLDTHLRLTLIQCCGGIGKVKPPSAG